jgi:hypothetical protein
VGLSHLYSDRGLYRSLSHKSSVGAVYIVGKPVLAPGILHPAPQVLAVTARVELWIRVGGCAPGR